MTNSKKLRVHSNRKYPHQNLARYKRELITYSNTPKLTLTSGHLETLFTIDTVGPLSIYSELVFLQKSMEEQITV